MTFEVEDDGKGFDPATAKRGAGECVSLTSSTMSVQALSLSAGAVCRSDGAGGRPQVDAALGRVTVDLRQFLSGKVAVI